MEPDLQQPRGLFDRVEQRLGFGGIIRAVGASRGAVDRVALSFPAGVGGCGPYTSIAFTARLAAAGIDDSVGAVGDAWTTPSPSR